MKFKDYPVRKKLLYSNFMMIGIPVLLVLLVMAAALSVLMFTTRLSGKLAEQGGAVYEMQYLFDSICGDLSHEHGSITDTELTGAFFELEQGGANIYVGTADGAAWYLSEGQSAEALRAEAASITGLPQNGDSLFYRDKNGLVYQTSLADGDGRQIELLVVNHAMAWKAGEFKTLTSIKQGIKLSVGITGGLIILIIVVTGILLARKLSKSILGPVEQLRSATERIKNGDLTTPIPPAARDELGDVTREFDGMRERLKESERERASYEQNRRELIAGISHDLRTPLTSIEGYLSGLRDGIANTPAKQAHYIDTAYETARQMDLLVEELFLLSKLDAGGLVFRLEPVDLAAYFADYCVDQREPLARQGLALRFVNTMPGPAAVRLDRAQFARVVQNLVGNSVKYQKEGGGQLTITLTQSAADAVQIQFTDNGRGVEAAETGKIFDSFYRTDKARANAAQGSGLGLAITKQLVQGMGGQIGAEGALGAGLTVWMRFPADTNERGGKP